MSLLNEDAVRGLGVWISPSQCSTYIHVDDGIKCTMWVATAHGLEGKSGSYFHNEVTEFLNPEELGRGDLMTPVAADPAEAAACWAQSLAMLGIPEAAFGHAC